MVKLINCYELDQQTGKAKVQSKDGDIWTEDAVNVFRTIFNAASPGITRKLKKAQENKREKFDLPSNDSSTIDIIHASPLRSPALTLPFWYDKTFWIHWWKWIVAAVGFIGSIASIISLL